MTTRDVFTGCWRKSTRSASQGACVEVAITKFAVGVRDSKDPRTTLVFSPRAWEQFAESLKWTKPTAHDT
ncbi:DUF397 domain-containing protein [Saccharopolyspora rectivirgula]|jgi:hypothetical protein|uniref:DUF397 domain-containing protein n=1 Tax=Saccharopolyspora rectivirgula TaxID=28042 RepID=UPI0009DE79F9|nr:DUF397 domain-containing protein [Saccharopolyspora rectivirgula]